MNWKCPLCGERIPREDIKDHLTEKIDLSFQKEEQAFKDTQLARELYKRLFKEEI